MVLAQAQTKTNGQKRDNSPAKKKKKKKKTNDKDSIGEQWGVMIFGINSVESI